MSLAHDRDSLLALAERVLERLPHGDGEVTVTESDASLTRVAHNVVHQSVAETSLTLRLRLQHQGRSGVASMRGGSGDVATAIERLVANAEDARRLAPAGEGMPFMPGPVEDAAAVDATAAFSQATAESSPEERADLVAVVTGAAAVAGLEAYGAMSTSATQTAIAGTSGLRRGARTSAAVLRATLRGQDGGGFADRTAVDVGDIAAASLAEEVVETTLRNQGATVLEPGTYEVLLSPYAVADLLGFVGGMVFSALAVQEHRSPFASGRRLCSELVDLADDPTDPAAAAFPFDGEGVSSRRVQLLDHGVASGLVHDTPTAMVDGTESTGHSLSQPNTWGPQCGHLVLAAGDRSHADLLHGVGRGLLLTRLWYIRIVHELNTVVTGMTREGTFLVEEGRIVGPVKDLRFTQSLLGALGDVRGVGSERRLQLDEYGGAVLAPWLHLGGFRFTS